MTLIKKLNQLKNSIILKVAVEVFKYAKRINAEKMFSLFEEELSNINVAMETMEVSDIPHRFRKVPLEVFGKLLLDIPAYYPNISAFFPSMPSEEVQKRWTGIHGEALLNQSVAFVKTMVSGYSVVTGKKIEDANILDYGCGWGRLIRLMYKFVPVENIYGVDPWDKSIEICKQNGLKGNLAISEYVPLSLPFNCEFDLILAFSVFTHLSQKTTQTVLNTLRRYIAKDGVLVITIRTKEFWTLRRYNSITADMIKMHNEKGFAFVPHHRPPVDGDITYGDTSMSLAYLAQNFTQWKVEAVEWNEVDPTQIILFLIPD